MKGKGGALSVWFSEFTSLVFTQTIQAFIYAIVISIILYGMKMNNVSDASSHDTNAALGLMSTFALLSVFKVEGFAKQIFGFKENRAAPGSAMKSLAKTAFALNLGKRVLNNVGKVTGGVRDIAKSRQDNAKAKKRLDEDMADNGFTRDKNGKLVYSGKSGSGGSEAYRAGSPTGVDGSAGAGGSSAAYSGDMSDAAKRRMKNALRSYEDKAAEIKKSRQEGIKNIISGTTESFGAVVGAAAGGVIGVADGDLDGLFNGIVAGAGVGDAVGEAMVNTLARATKSVKNVSNMGKGMSTKKLKSAISEYKSAIENANVYYGKDDVDGL